MEQLHQLNHDNKIMIAKYILDKASVNNRITDEELFENILMKHLKRMNTLDLKLTLALIEMIRKDYNNVDHQ